MIKAYLLLTLKMGLTKQVVEEIKKIKGLESVAMVTGAFDVIVTVKVNNLEELYQLTFVTLSNIEGINNITTHIVEKEITSED
ncbi:MAG: Lrp/AsnC ligand binding domain-containing protein [Promethearchaeota archaeon]